MRKFFVGLTWVGLILWVGTIATCLILTTSKISELSTTKDSLYGIFFPPFVLGSVLMVTGAAVVSGLPEPVRKAAIVLTNISSPPTEIALQRERSLKMDADRIARERARAAEQRLAIALQEEEERNRLAEENAQIAALLEQAQAQGAKVTVKRFVGDAEIEITLDPAADEKRNRKKKQRELDDTAW